MIGNTLNLGRVPTEEARAHMRASAPKTHSAEHNKRVGESLKAKGIKPPGEDPEQHHERMLGNQYLTGKKFIHRGEEKKAVSADDLDKYLQDGWILGRWKNRKGDN